MVTEADLLVFVPFAGIGSVARGDWVKLRPRGLAPVVALTV